MKSRTKIITIDDFPGPAVEALVWFFYLQEITPSVLDEHAADLWGLGDKYQVKALQRHIVLLIPQFVTVGNVKELISRANVYGARDVYAFFY